MGDKGGWSFGFNLTNLGRHYERQRNKEMNISYFCSPVRDMMRDVLKASQLDHHLGDFENRWFNAQSNPLAPDSGSSYIWMK